MKLGSMVFASIGVVLGVWCTYLTWVVRDSAKELAAQRIRIVTLEKRVEGLKSRGESLGIAGTEIAMTEAQRKIAGTPERQGPDKSSRSVLPSAEEREIATKASPLQREFQTSSAYSEAQKCLAEGDGSGERVELLLKVNSEGKVVNVLQTTQNAKTRSCLVGAAKRWSPPKGTTIAELSVVRD